MFHVEHQEESSIPLDALKELFYAKGFSNQDVEFLTSTAQLVTHEPNEDITRQFETANHFFLLVSGEIQFSIQLDSAESRYSIGTSNHIWTPLGWSGFRKPHRYSTTATSAGKSATLRWEIKRLNKVFDVHPKTGIQFLTFLAERSLLLMNEARTKLISYRPIDIDPELQYQVIGEQSASTAQAPDIHDLLKRSPFFEVFEDHEIKVMQDIAFHSYHLRGEILIRQGDAPNAFMIMGNGKVSLHHYNQSFTSPVQDDIVDQSAVIRSISTVGYAVDYASTLKNKHNQLSIRVVRDCNIINIPQEGLDKYIRENPVFGLKFYQRLLWLISTHLRSIRTQLISHEYEREIVAIKNLIDQNCTQLSVLSPLHKLPHLLNHTYTLEDAFQCLQTVSKSGSTLERGLATVCYEILGDLYRESNFYNGLQNIYHSISNLDSTKDPTACRILCAQQFANIFDKVPHVISGEEHLPNSPGNIFIFNHLVNHSYNTLPNDFQLTLDSHFISSMILYKKYGDAGIRVVRVSRGIEYGHQNYYNKLGHIDVYTKESDQLEETPEQKRQRLDEFYRTAESYLNAGTSLILAPEGTSYHTQDSPGPFKAGAFVLATKMNPEPNIVPIAVANFDQRLNRSTLSVVIKKPFKMSDLVKDSTNRNEMNAFLIQLQQDYKGYVREAIHQASLENPKTIIQ